MAAEFITYEQPLNEPIRICLRLEHLFQQLHDHLKKSTTADSHLAMIALLKTLNVIDRPDLKPKLTQTLTQQATALAQLEHSPQVDANKLRDLLARLDKLIEHLHQTHGKIGEDLRQNLFLNQIRLHLHNPAGPCNFNTPGYSLWLHQAPEKRISDLQRWTSAFDQLQSVVSTILFITRDCASSQQTTAQQGLYQQTLDANLPCQLIRVKVPTTTHLYPEISAGIHRLVIRFLPLDTQRASPIPPTAENVNFVLSCCRV
jgi:cell division protein ZapD